MILRGYLRSHKPADQATARQRCQAAGIHYLAAWREANGSTGSPPAPEEP